MTTQAAVASPPRGDAVEIIVNQSGRYADVVGLTDDELAALYNLAYNRYQQGQYEEAERVFRVLCLHDHLSDRYWLGLGAARQMLRDYQGAVLAYSMVAEMGHPNPLAPLHAAECYLALGLYDEALSGVETALEWAPMGEEPEKITKHVEALFATLEKMVDALPDESPPAQAGQAD